MMKKIFYTMTLILTVSLAMAQGTDPQDKQSNPRSSDVSQTRKAKPVPSTSSTAAPPSSSSSSTAASSKPQTPVTFTPSEHISDDLSVSFPVDI